MVTFRFFRRTLFVMLALGLSLGLLSVANAAQDPPATGKALPAAPATAVAGPLAATTCTPTWTAGASISPGTLQNQLSAVGVVAANDIWVVGYGEMVDQSYFPIMQHWNGISWSVVSLPAIGTERVLLNGIAVRAANDIWVVGQYTISNLWRTLALHWDGTAWSVVTTPNHGTDATYLFDVVAITANDIWAGGLYQQPTAWKSFLMHWDGAQWSDTSSNGPTQSYVEALGAVATNDIWGVGEGASSNAWQSYITHWNGATWTQVASPSPGATYNYVSGVSGAATNDVWAVGTYRNAANLWQTLMLHWNGLQWSLVNSPNVGTGDNHLYGVRALATNDVWAVGDTTGSNGLQTLVLHWDGLTWSVVPSANSGAGDNKLYDIAAVNGSDLWAVGLRAASPGAVPGTLITHYSAACGPPSPCSLQFDDVPPGDPFYPYIRCLACRNILSGYADGTFHPGAPITRGQAAKILSNAASYTDAIPSGQQTFADVPATSPFWLFVERGVGHAVVSGYPCGGVGEPCDGQNRPYFRPGVNLTRGQLAKIDANTAGYTDAIPSGQQTFADVPASSPFWLYVERVAAQGVISGYACGGPGEPCDGQNRPYFRPGNPVTRAQTAKIVSNTFFPGCQTPARPLGK